MLPEILLDDVRFQELVSEARTRIVRHSPEWTEHNVSDPGITLIELFAWSEDEFNRKMEGSAIRRIGHERWLRNLAVGMGNAAAKARGQADIVAALLSRREHPSAMVREHIEWALALHSAV